MFILFLLTKLIKPEENESDSNECDGKDSDPHKHTANTLCINVYKKVGIDERSGSGGNENGCIKLKDKSLNKKENNVSKGECDGSDGIDELALLTLVEEEPIKYVHDRKNYVEKKATDAPVCLRITALGTCEHNVEHEEGEKDSEHTDELDERYSGNVAIILFLYSLDKSGNHSTDAKEIADVGKVDVEIPTYYVNIVEYSETCNESNKSKRTVDRLVNKLYCSVFDHKGTPLYFYSHFSILLVTKVLQIIKKAAKNMPLSDLFLLFFKLEHRAGLIRPAIL